MHLPLLLLHLGLLATTALAQCLRCTPDACSAALVPTPSVHSSALSACASWLSVTITPTPTVTTTSTLYLSASATSTTTLVSSVTVTSTSTSTLVTASATTSVSSTSTQVLQRRQSSPSPPGNSTSGEPGDIVPDTVPSPYAGPCADVGAFFSACICAGARPATVTAAPATQTVTQTVTGSDVVATSESLVTATTTATATDTTETTTDTTETSGTATTTVGTTTATAAPTGRLLVTPGSGSPVDGQYVFANSSYVSQSNSTGNVAIALQFTPDASQADLFSIDAATGGLTGYEIGTYLGTQALYDGAQDTGDFYNAYLLVPQGYVDNSDLPVPACRNTGGLSQGLQCVEDDSGDSRDVFQYCPGDQSWFGPFGYQTTGFLVLDSVLDNNCSPINLQFVNQ